MLRGRIGESWMQSVRSLLCVLTPEETDRLVWGGKDRDSREHGGLGRGGDAFVRFESPEFAAQYRTLVKTLRSALQSAMPFLGEPGRFFRATGSGLHPDDARQVVAALDWLITRWMGDGTVADTGRVRERRLGPKERLHIMKGCIPVESTDDGARLAKACLDVIDESLFAIDTSGHGVRAIVAQIFASEEIETTPRSALALGCDGYRLAALLSLWIAADADLSCAIGRSELHDWLGTVSAPFTAYGVDVLFDLVDTSRNGLLEFDEFASVVCVITTLAPLREPFLELVRATSRSTYVRSPRWLAVSAYRTPRTDVVYGFGRRGASLAQGGGPARHGATGAGTSFGGGSFGGGSDAGSSGAGTGGSAGSLKRGDDVPQGGCFDATFTVDALVWFLTHHQAEPAPRVRQLLRFLRGASVSADTDDPTSRVDGHDGETLGHEMSDVTSDRGSTSQAATTIIAESGRPSTEVTTDDADNAATGNVTVTREEALRELRDCHFSFEQFQWLMTNHTINSWRNPADLREHMDMRQPLNYYWCNSSHNTYLVAQQVLDHAAVPMYSTCLREGCRCLEIDVWNGADGLPIVTHGYAGIFKHLELRAVAEEIRDAAFLTNPYPIILSLEVHLNLEQQRQMARIFREVFGDALLTAEQTLRCDWSPEGLKYRILLKGKYKKSEMAAPVPELAAIDMAPMFDATLNGTLGGQMGSPLTTHAVGVTAPHIATTAMTPPAAAAVDPAYAADGEGLGAAAGAGLGEDEEDEDDGMEDIDEGGEEKIDMVGRLYMNMRKLASAMKGKKAHSKKVMVADEMCEITAVRAEGRRPDTFLRPGGKYIPYGVTSIKEGAGVTWATRPETAMQIAHVANNYLLRMYPNGDRLASSNYDPVPGLLCGVQMVALNYQTNDRYMRLYRDFFRTNGNCGYILKPASHRRKIGGYKQSLLRSDFIHEVKVTIEVLAGAFLPLPPTLRRLGIVGQATDDIFSCDPFADGESLNVDANTFAGQPTPHHPLDAVRWGFAATSTAAVKAFHWTKGAVGVQAENEGTLQPIVVVRFNGRVTKAQRKTPRVGTAPILGGGNAASVAAAAAAGNPSPKKGATAGNSGEHRYKDHRLTEETVTDTRNDDGDDMYDTVEPTKVTTFCTSFTLPLRSNGLAPQWDDVITCSVLEPSVTTVTIAVYHKEEAEQNLVGDCTCPVTALRQGLRMVPLAPARHFTAPGSRFDYFPPPTGLMVRIQKVETPVNWAADDRDPVNANDLSLL